MLNQIIITCKRFCHHCLMKVTSVFHLQLEEDSHNDDNDGAPKLIILRKKISQHVSKNEITETSLD